MPLKEITDLNEKLSVNPTDFLLVKQGSEDVKVTPATLFNLHKLESNPHGITKTTVGLGNVTDDAQLTIDNNLSDLTDPAQARINLGIYSSGETNTEINNHANLTNNPHSVTASQVGLGNVSNYTISHNPDENVQTKFASIAAVNTVREQVNLLVPNVIPSGAIIMWSGNTVPSGWRLCNGLDGTPDLRNRFIRGGDLTNNGETGGVESQSHSHSGSVQGHTLTVDEMPNHQHTGWGQKGANVWEFGVVGPNTNFGAKGENDSNNYYYNTSGVLNHGYTYDGVVKNDAHTHGLVLDDSAVLDNKPPYYTLAFIQKI